MRPVLTMPALSLSPLRKEEEREMVPLELRLVEREADEADGLFVSAAVGILVPDGDGE